MGDYKCIKCKKEFEEMEPMWELYMTEVDGLRELKYRISEKCCMICASSIMEGLMKVHVKKYERYKKVGYK